MALLNYKWNNGTDENPIELNQSQLNNLLKLALNEQIVSDVRGHIATSSGLIAKYTKWQLEQKYEHLVIHAEETADTLSLVPVRSAINEGEQTTITVTGMTASSVKFRLQHSFRNVYGISQSAAQARIHMDGNVLIVDEPEENASWIDDVTVQAIPIYEEWSNPETIASCTVTVTAKELTGIVLTALDVCVLGETFAADVTLIPGTNTKKNHVALDASCISDGALAVRKPTVQGLAVYTAAPAEDCSLTLTVNAYLFGDTGAVAFTDTVSGIHSMNPYIQFTITTDGTFSDISSANPKITLQKVDSEDEPIGQPIVLTGTVSGSSLVYTYGGGNVAGDGSEIYKVSIERVNLYKVGTLENVIPNDVITLYNINYVVFTPDVYIVKSDGTKITYEEFVAGGFVLPNNVTAVEVELEDTNYLIDIQTLRLPFGRYNKGINNGVFKICTTFNELIEDKNGFLYTGIAYPISDGTTYANGTAINAAYDTVKTIGNKSYKGYIPAFGELYCAILNKSVFAVLNSYSGNAENTINLTAFRIITSTLSLADNNVEDPLFIRSINQNGATADRRTANQTTLVFLKEITA